MKNDVVPVQIRGILPANSGCALFVGNDEKVFVINVEPNMGAVIGMFLRQTPKERPLTHDLIQSIFKGFGITVERVVITELKNSTYFARLILQQQNELGRKIVEIDARPSDCLALATAQKRPIYVTNSLFEQVEDMSEVLERINETGERGGIGRCLRPPPSMPPRWCWSAARTISPSSSAPARSTSSGPRSWAAWTTKSLTPPFPTAARPSRPSAKLREALQTLPFFGTGKAIWLKDCNFLGDERAASPGRHRARSPTSPQELKDFAWQNVRLLISAGKVDKRKTFYKALDKLGAVETFAGWSVDDRDWADQAETWAAQSPARPPEGHLRRSAGGADQPRRPQPPPARQRDREAHPLCRRPPGNRVRRRRRRLLPQQDGPRLRARRRAGRPRSAPAAAPGWTRSCGRSSSTRTSRRSACSTA